MLVPGGGGGGVNDPLHTDNKLGVPDEHSLRRRTLSLANKVS